MCHYIHNRIKCCFIDLGGLVHPSSWEKTSFYPSLGSSGCATKLLNMSSCLLSLLNDAVHLAFNGCRTAGWVFSSELPNEVKTSQRPELPLPKVPLHRHRPPRRTGGATDSACSPGFTMRMAAWQRSEVERIKSGTSVSSVTVKTVARMEKEHDVNVDSWNKPETGTNQKLGLPSSQRPRKFLHTKTTLHRSRNLQVILRDISVPCVEIHRPQVSLQAKFIFKSARREQKRRDFAIRNSPVGRPSLGFGRAPKRRCFGAFRPVRPIRG